MKQYNVMLLILSIILIAGCASTNYENQLFNDDLTKSKLSSPLELILNVTTLPDKEMEISASVYLIQGFSEQVAPNVSMQITLPPQLELIDGKLGFVGLDIPQGAVVQNTIKVRAVSDGEGVVDANVVTAPRDGYYYGDNEKSYINVTADNVLIKDSPFTESGTLHDVIRIDDVPANQTNSEPEDTVKVPRKN